MSPIAKSTALRPTAARLAAAGAVLLLAACSSASTQTAASSPSPSAPVASSSTAATPSAVAPTASPTKAGTGQITISNFAYSTTGTILAGQPVSIVNDDGATHTVAITGTKVDVTVPGHGKASLTAPDKPGQYALTCDFHGNMHGRLTVT